MGINTEKSRCVIKKHVNREDGKGKVIHAYLPYFRYLFFLSFVSLCWFRSQLLLSHSWVGFQLIRASEISRKCVFLSLVDSSKSLWDGTTCMYVRICKATFLYKSVNGLLPLCACAVEKGGRMGTIFTECLIID